jgi:hypothetical protein
MNDAETFLRENVFVCSEFPEIYRTFTVAVELV